MENVLYDYHFSFHYVMPELIAFSSGAAVLIAGIILFIKLKNRKHAKIAGIIAMMLSSPLMSMSVFNISTAVHDHVIIKNAIKNGKSVERSLLPFFVAGASPSLLSPRARPLRPT